MMRKLQLAREILRQDGVRGLASQGFLLVLRKYASRIPLSRVKWSAGLKNETDFWDDYFRTRGGEWPESYRLRLDPEQPLQPRPAALLPERAEVEILDVGAGPMSYLGKKLPGRTLDITAVDPLADHYTRILKKYAVSPPVRTQKLAAEQLTSRFLANQFDLVFARNCIDHSYNPEAAILQMVTVVKPGGWVLLEHAPNEAEKESYRGLHQWNFSMAPDGHFLIQSRHGRVDMTAKYADRCTITCELGHEDGVGEWLVTRILKK